jgi:hypothetical protein
MKISFKHKHAANPARHRVIGNRAVRDRKVRLLQVVVAYAFKLDIIHPGDRTTVERRVNQRSYDVPDLRKALACQLAQGLGIELPYGYFETAWFLSGRYLANVTHRWDLVQAVELKARRAVESQRHVTD